MKRKFLVSLGCSVLAMAAMGWAGMAAAESVAPIASLVVKGAGQFDMRSQAGRDYRIFVAVPDKPAPAAGYGVLYVLDGNAMFLTALETVRATERRPDVPPGQATIVVGIGYPDGTDIGKERTYDLTPPGSGNERIKAPSGGADAFLAFLQDQVKPEIARLHPVDPRRQGVFGHSFGGLFVLHALQRSPDAFTYWTAASPSIWFDREGITGRLGRWAAARPKDAPELHVLLTAGEYEQALSPFAYTRPNVTKLAELQRERGQVDSGRALSKVLDAGNGLQVRFDEIVGEDHGTVIPAAISRAVSQMLMPGIDVPPVPSAIAYWQMTPDQRYDLRMWVRQLPDKQRIPWLTALRDTLHDGLDNSQQAFLHDERNRFDAENGSKPHAVNATAR